MLPGYPTSTTSTDGSAPQGSSTSGGGNQMITTGSSNPVITTQSQQPGDGADVDGSDIGAAACVGAFEII